MSKNNGHANNPGCAIAFLVAAAVGCYALFNLARGAFEEPPENPRYSGPVNFFNADRTCDAIIDQDTQTITVEFGTQNGSDTFEGPYDNRSRLTSDGTMYTGTIRQNSYTLNFKFNMDSNNPEKLDKNDKGYCWITGGVAANIPAKELAPATSLTFKKDLL